MAAKNKKRRSEGAGLLHFGKEMGSALLMALIAIVYVIQAFRIPTGSMEDSLKAGDFLLGLKFIYGAPVVPFSYAKFPGVTDPKPGDVVIFKYPGTSRKDYIKRCVAGPGQTISIEGKSVFVDGEKLIMPPEGKHGNNGLIGTAYGGLNRNVMEFKPLTIPKKGDQIKVADLPTREFHFLKHLVRQEHPRKEVRADYQLYRNGEYVTSYDFARVDDWTQIDQYLQQARAQLANGDGGADIDVKMLLYLDGERVSTYTVRNDNYFMLGDNRDNSLDSRFWGYLNRNFVKAKAFILYFSLDQDTPFFLLPLKIRWERIGRLIRSWDGMPPVPQTAAATR